MDRRTLLKALALLALGPGLSACGGAGTAGSVKIMLLDQAMPDQLIRAFKKQYTGNLGLKFEAAEQLALLYAQLLRMRDAAPPLKRIGRELSWQFWRRPNRPADLISLGDAWLTPAIRQHLIQPLDMADLSHWSTLPEDPWQTLVMRDRAGMPAADSLIWGAPYRWGSLMLVYRDRPFQSLGWQPTDWADLWKPELTGQISLPANPRLLLGIVLKKLGLSVNAQDLQQDWPKIEADIKALHRQVKFYSSDHYLQALVTKGTTLAVGWSTDILPTLSRNRTLKTAVPTSGTILSADVWVKPSSQARLNVADTLTDILESPSPFLEQSPLQPWTEFLNELDAIAPQQIQSSAPAPELHRLTSPLTDWIDFLWQPGVATQFSVNDHGASPLYTSQDATDLPEPLQGNASLLPTTEIYEDSEFLYPLQDADAKHYRSILKQL